MHNLHGTHCPDGEHQNCMWSCLPQTLYFGMERPEERMPPLQERYNISLAFYVLSIFSILLSVQNLV